LPPAPSPERFDKRGAALLITLVFLLVLVGLATAAAIFAQNSQLTAKAQLLDKQAFYIAEAGIHRARQQVEAGNWASGSTNTESFGAGEYSVTIADNGDCASGSSDCEYTVTSNAYIPSSSSYVARRQLVEDEIPVTVSNTNLSLTATASASSAESGKPASNANDGNTGTEWRASTAGNGQWLRMDHGSATTVNRIVVLEKDNIDGISAVEYSDNGSTWTAVSGLSVVESPSKTWTSNFTSTSHRYFRVVFTASGSGDKVRVKEQQHYNTASGTVSINGSGDYTTSW
jgi:Tfp pilus assembly protein PilX